MDNLLEKALDQDKGKLPENEIKHTCTIEAGIDFLKEFEYSLVSRNGWVSGLEQFHFLIDDVILEDLGMNRIIINEHQLRSYALLSRVVARNQVKSNEYELKDNFRKMVTELSLGI